MPFSCTLSFLDIQYKHSKQLSAFWWGAGTVICLERGADLHMAQLMPLPLTVSCFSKIQIGFTLLVPAHPGSPGKRAVKRVCVCQHFVQSHNTAKNTNFLCSVNHYLDCCTDKTITKQILTQSTHLRVQLWLPGTISLLTLELMAEANFL